MRKWMLVGLAWPGAVLAQAQTPAPTQTAGPPRSAQGDVQVTIYANDTALIEDARTVTLPAGRSRQEFADVSASIRPETVTLGGDGFGVVEQNFDYDLLSPGALMAKAVGQQITLLRTNPATGAETRQRATVLAANDGVVLRVGEQIEVLRDDGLPVRVIFDAIPPNLRARPTLSVTVEASRAGPRPMTLSYLSRGMSWRADYVALFDQRAGRLDMQGWITLSNTTGTSFADARTTLVAGEVGQLQQGYRPRPPAVPQGNVAGTESGRRERLGDLYLYPIAGRTTIATNQQKQVSFLDASGVAAARAYEYRNEWMGSEDQAQSAASVLRFSAGRAGGIGDALPAGTVRVYMRDTQGRAQFVGEVAIPHTPAGSRLALRTGDAFDVKVQSVVEKREKITADEWERTARWRLTDGDGRVIAQATTQTQVQYWRTTMRYVVTNAKPEPVTVDVIQGGLSPLYESGTRVPSETIRGEQLNAGERLWHVPVPANGKTELVVQFDSRY